MVRFVIIIISMLLASCVGGDQTISLHPKHGPAVLKQCSRHTPQSDSFFRASIDEITELEASLDDVTNLTPVSWYQNFRVQKPQRFKRQYIGYTSNDERFIYINAMSDSFAPKMTGSPIIICDGGPEAWGVSYDLARKQFFGLELNGAG